LEVSLFCQHFPIAKTHVNIPHCAQTGSCPAGIVNRRHSDVIYPPVKRSNWDPPLNAGQWLLLSTHGLRFAATKLFKLALGWRSIVLTSVLRTLYRPVIAGNWLEPLFRVCLFGERNGNKNL
jgi:hypothetical protein